MKNLWSAGNNVNRLPIVIQPAVSTLQTTLLKCMVRLDYRDSLKPIKSTICDINFSLNWGGGGAFHNKAKIGLAISRNIDRIVIKQVLIPFQKEAPKLFRRATIYSVVVSAIMSDPKNNFHIFTFQDQQNEAGREDNIQTMSVQDPHSGLGGASSLFSPPRNAMSSPASVSLTSSDARYAKIDVAGALSPSQAGFLPQWQSSPLTQNTYQSPIGQNQSPLHAGLRGLDVSQTSLSLQNPLYSSSSLIPSPQNVHYVAEPFPFASFPSNQLPTLNPNQTSNQSTNQASLQTAGGQKVSTTFTDSLVSAQLKTGGARIRRNTSMSAKEMSSMGAVNTSPHAGGSLEKCVPLDSGRQSHSASLKNTFEDSFHQPSSYEDTQARTPSQASFKGDLPIQSGPHNTHAPASPFEDDFLPIFQANRNEPNAPANATTNSTPSAMTHMFEDSFTSPPVHFLTGDSFQTSQSFENSFQSSLTFNPFDDNFYTLVSQNIEQQPTFVNDSSTSSNLHINPQPFVGFEDHFVQ